MSELQEFLLVVEDNREQALGIASIAAQSKVFPIRFSICQDPEY